MKKRGFTLIEMLVVIAIIGMLMALLLPALAAARKRAHITKARAIAIQVETAIKALIEDTRKTDILSETETTSALVNKLADAPSTGRIYLEVSEDEVSDGLKDPWGEFYQIAYAVDGKVNASGETLYRLVAVWSKGPDKDSGTDDDVKSWTTKKAD